MPKENQEITEPRIVRVRVEMELLEGRDFYKSTSDIFAIEAAEVAFAREVRKGNINLFDWMQSKIVEPIGDN